MSENKRPEWLASPASTVGLATAGSKVTGQVRVVFNRADDAHVSTDHNMADLMVGTSGPYWISVQVTRVDGTWKVSDYLPHFSRKDMILDRKPFPTTHRAAIVEAVERVVSDLATPNVLALADYANARQDAHRLHPDIVKAERELADLRNQMRQAQRVIRRFEHPGES